MKRAIVGLVVVALAISAWALTPPAPQPPAGTVTVTLISPRAGDVLTPGQTVKVQWAYQVHYPYVKWQEQELRLSLDGGKTYNIHVGGSLNGDVRTLNWVVPNNPTPNAMIDIRYGNLYGPEREVSNPQSRSTFTIRKIQ